MFKKLLKKLASPNHLWKAYKASKSKKPRSRSMEDPQLKLYDKILKTDFLHYGYFDDKTKQASKISFDDIRQAQVRYAELILEQVLDKKGPVLDIGCGMGGLIGMLLKMGMETVGVTPDRVQINYISNKYREAKLLHTKFQNMPDKEYPAYFATVIHSESLQYMGLEKAINNVLAVLKPGGRWIVVDYFRTAESGEKSGHYWDVFQEKLQNSNLEIVHAHDITENIKPTLEFIYMWGNEIVKPVFEFFTGKLEKKHPGKHYMLSEAIEGLTKKIDKNLDMVNPQVFAKNKKYILLSIERKN